MSFVKEAFDQNWVAPLGPNVDEFEKEITNYIKVKNCCALSSGTAALHLALKVVGIKSNDKVLCNTFTFSAERLPAL